MCDLLCEILTCVLSGGSFNDISGFSIDANLYVDFKSHF